MPVQSYEKIGLAQLNFHKKSQRIEKSTLSSPNKFYRQHISLKDSFSFYCGWLNMQFLQIEGKLFSFTSN